MELAKWIRSKEKIFAILEISEENKVTIGIFYFTRKADS